MNGFECLVFRFGDLALNAGPIDEGIPNSSENWNGFVFLFVFRFGDPDLVVGSMDQGIPNSSENSNGFDFLVFKFKLVFGDPDRRGWPDGGTLKSNSSLTRRLLLGWSLPSVLHALANGEGSISISSEKVNGGGGGRGALVFVVFAENGGLETNAGGCARDCASSGFSVGAGGVEEIRSITSGILCFV